MYFFGSKRFLKKKLSRWSKKYTPGSTASCSKVVKKRSLFGHFYEKKHDFKNIHNLLGEQDAIYQTTQKLLPEQPLDDIRWLIKVLQYSGLKPVLLFQDTIDGIDLGLLN